MEAAGGGEVCAGCRCRRNREELAEHAGDLVMGWMVMLPLGRAVILAASSRAEHGRPRSESKIPPTFEEVCW